MNPYYQNWNYGYTLGAPTEASRGAYTVYGAQTQGGANPANLATPGTTTHVQSEPGPAGGWAQVKGTQPSNPIKAQVFVTAGSTSVKSEYLPTTAGLKSSSNWNPTAAAIGPNKPQAIVNPSQFQGDQLAAALSSLHDLATSNKLVERYEKVEEVASSGSPSSNFKVNLFLGTETYQGTGSTIKAAKQHAALQALASTKYQSEKEKKYSLSTIAALGSRRIGVTATSELHELATKKGVRVDFKFLEPFNFEFKHSMRMWDKKEMLGNYRVQLNVAGYEFYGQAELPQQAKHNAATQAMPIVRNLPDPAAVASVVTSPTISSDPEAGATISCGPTGSIQKNVNMALNEIAMMNGCVPEWSLISETGPPHQKVFTWQLSLGQYVTTGTGANKKIARNSAAEQMLATIPEEWKQKAGKIKKRTGAAKKRGSSGGGGSPPAKKKVGEDGKIVITADNPISCLFEYAKKVKIPDPQFDCVAENLLETWQQESKTYKKIEYTIQLQIDGKTYLAASNTKKAAKIACATEAWNYIRATLL